MRQMQLKSRSLAFLSSILFAGAAPGATLVVDPAGGGDHTAIQPALDAAADGDTVLVLPGEYAIAARLDFNPLRDPEHPGGLPTKNLVLRSQAGAQATVLRWTGGPAIEYPTAIIVFRNGETAASLVEGFTMVDGPAAVWSWEGSPIIRRCVMVRNGIGVDGGAVTLQIEECLITGNGMGAAFEGGKPTILRSTIGRNSAGLNIADQGVVTGSIIWGNPGGSDVNEDGLTVSFSNYELPDLPPGPGNIRADPLFCGWASAEVHVDAAAPAGGDGTPGRPYRDLQAALDPFAYSLALAPGSPCLGTGGGGANMGADLGTCATAPVPRRMVRVAKGSYSLAGFSLLSASLEGAGAEETVLHGTVHGLESGAVLSGVTVTGGTGGGISFRILQGEGPVIERCRITGNRGGSGITCFGSATITDCVIDRNQSDFIGGGVRCDGPLVLRNSRIVDNAALRGGGVASGQLLLDHCTISGNAGGGLWADSTTITSSIVWGNAGGPSLFVAEGSPPAAVSFSLIEGNVVWPGPGNLDADPIFCGVAGGPILHVDQAAPGPGDGSAEDPYPDLGAALDHGYGLAAGSPCLGSGAGGSDMGAPAEPCGSPGRTGRLVLLAPGEYDLGQRPLAHGFSLAGAGEEQTIVRGTVEGLRSGAFLGFLSVTAGTEGGARIVEESPRVLHVTLRENSGGGLGCWGASPSIEGATIRENGGGGVYLNDSPAFLTNCVIIANSRGAYSAVVVDGTLSPVFRNCTITGNSGLPYGPGGIHCFPDTSPAFRSCIIWQNPVDTNFEGSCYSGTLTACLNGVDPLFADPGVFDFTRFRLVEIGGGLVQIPDFIVEEPDLRLQPESPAVDAGSAAGAPGTDILGALRPCGPLPDIGAHEFGGCSASAIADDAGRDTWSTGEWTVSGGSNPHAARSLYSREAGAAYAFFVPLPGPGRYRVSLWWTHWPSRLTAVPIEVLHDSGSTLIPVNQRVNGGKWNTLGEWGFEGARAIVIVHSPGGGTVCADAVRVSAVGSPEAVVLDNGEPGTSSTGYWPVSGAPGPYGANSLFSRDAGVKYTFALSLPAAGNYEAFLWWTPYASRSDRVRVDVEQASGTTAVFVNQKLGGSRWNSIGTYTFAETARITIHSTGGASTCADAVKLEPSSAAPAPAEVIVDNGEPGAAATGKWIVSGGLHPYGVNSLYSHEAGAKYSYVLAVPRDGVYEAFLWWTTYASRLAVVRVDVAPGDGTLHTKYIDQRTGGGAWNSLGTFTVRGHPTITIHSGGGGSTCADAARMVERP